MKAANRVIVNTAILYGKMIITASIALISTRWVLESLGQTDYGIYSLVGGIIAMFSFLNVAMAAATQRYLSYSLGQRNENIMRDTFKCSVILHIIIGIIIFGLFEVLGNFFLHHKLQIPPERMDAAMASLHCLSFSTVFTILTVPYQALLNAKENMLVIAGISIYESIVKLGIAVYLLKYIGDRLILYSILMMCLCISSLLINRLYCWKKYKEVHINWRKRIDLALFRKMFSFAGWNFIGSISSLLRNQGLAMLMNSFFGVIINAAYGVATQINGQAQFFSRTIIRAVQPQIVKSEGAGDRARMVKIAMTTCKLTFLILSFVIAPLVSQISFILRIWLKEVPSEAPVFCSLILCITLLSQIKMGLSIAIDSVGRIKWYQIVCGGLHFVVLPIAYILYRLGFSAYYGLEVVIIEEAVTILLTSYFAHKLATISLKYYYQKVFFPCIVSVVSVYVSIYYITVLIEDGWVRLASFTVCYIIMLGWVGYKFLLNKSEQDTFISFTNTLVKKLKFK